MSQAVVSFFLETLDGFLSREYQLVSNIHEDFIWIKDEVQCIRRYLKDAYQRRSREKEVDVWVTQLRRLLFNAEDTIDDFIIKREMWLCVRDETLKGCIFFHVCFPRRLIIRRQFGTRILSIRRQLMQIDERRVRYNLQPTSTTDVSTTTTNIGLGDPGAASPLVEEADIVGIKEHALKLSKQIESEKKERFVISIVGMGGLGKTTLAKQVYKLIKRSVKHHAWIFVSQSFAIKDLLKKILKAFYESQEDEIPSNIEDLDEPQLRHMIQGYLKGKRYVLFLDDVWVMDVWEGVKHSLPRESGGRVIFTTRDADVGRLANEEFHNFVLNRLQPNEAWELFCKKAFRNKADDERKCPQHLKDVAEAIVQKCNGLPLAIVAIGGLMSKRSTHLLQWKDVLENLDWELSQRPELKMLNHALLTSYYYLPDHLKYCFLYCALFPEGEIISRYKLIRLWVAEGFIENHPQSTPEELARVYFQQLVDRNMLIPVTSTFDGKVKKYTLHTLVRQMARHMFEEEDFGMEVSGVQKIHGRHLVMLDEMHGPPFNGALIDKNEINPRSLLVFIKQAFPIIILRQTLASYRLLRVLELQGVEIETLPDEMGGLVHLRYLCLRDTSIKSLPASLGRLYRLQTLDVRKTEVTELPPNSTFLQLRHLFFHDGQENKIVASDLQHSIKLQTLYGISANLMLVKQLRYFSEIRKLVILELTYEHWAELCTSMSQMQRLRSLRLRAATKSGVLIEMEMLSAPPRYLEALKLLVPMNKLPSWVGSLACLRKIQLQYCDMEEDPLVVLQQLPNLVELKMFNAYKGRKWGCGSYGFPMLKRLLVHEMKQLEEWSEIQAGVFPKLHLLAIGRCPKLQVLPHGLQHLKALERLLIVEMPKEFVDRIHTQEEHSKIQHIPQLFVRDVSHKSLASEGAS